MKAQLNPIDKIKAAYLYYVHDLNQSLITEILECNNSGRINEAIKAIEKAVGINGGGYKQKKES